MMTKLAILALGMLIGATFCMVFIALCKMAGDLDELEEREGKR